MKTSQSTNNKQPFRRYMQEKLAITVLVMMLALIALVIVLYTTVQNKNEDYTCLLYTSYRFLFVPKWEQLKNVDTWVMAMGQAFFSLSITGSGMIVYGSYLNKNADIIGASMRTAVFDTIAALLSALAIMPAVFAFGIEPGSGPSLMSVSYTHLDVYKRQALVSAKEEDNRISWEHF